MFEIIKTALIDFSIYGLFVLIYTLVGAYQNINIWGMKFEWKLWLNGIVKYLVLGAAVLGSVIGSYLLIAQANAQGIELVNAQAIAPRVIFSTVLLGSAAILVKIIAKLATKIGVSDETLKYIQTQSVNTDTDKPLILNLNDVPMPSEDYIAAKLKAELEGGIGNAYSVPTNSYAAFRAVVLGNGYDIDNYYGWQCWDGDALLWQQFGKQLITGNGLAIGCWDLNRDRNKYDLFTLIDNVNGLELGDAVVMRPNHIGFFDGYDGEYMLILGQNQGGNPRGAAGGSAFNVVRIHKSAFAGAFRLDEWHVVSIPTPVPVPTPTPIEPVATDFVVGDIVVPTVLVDYSGKSLKQWDDTYIITEVIGDRAVLSARGQIWAAMHTTNIKKV